MAERPPASGRPSEPGQARPWVPRVSGEAPPSRMAAPEDYDAIAAVVNDWWGRAVLGALPRLFLDLFYRTSLVVDGRDGPLAFLVGILSPSDAEQAYIHFVGVAPEARGLGLGRRLYEEFLDMARRDGRSVVHSVTAPVNAGSIAFHQAMGFTVSGPVAGYDGPGRDFMVFERRL